jgi:hypothetical protein
VHSPTVDGLVGITTEVSGRPSAVLMLCQHPLGGVTVYWSDAPAGSDSDHAGSDSDHAGSDSDHAVLAQWKLPAGYKPPVQWLLLSSKPVGVSILKKPVALVPGRPYVIYGWTHEGPYYSAVGPDFKAEDSLSCFRARF